MKQVLMQSGKVIVKDVPAPVIEHGCVLVQVEYSCISPGTEAAALQTGSTPLWKRALREPEKIKQVLNMAVRHGISSTRQVVNERIFRQFPLGYSAAGTVIEVGEGISRFKVGDRVACAGAQCAWHADIICVHENLVVHIPDNVTTRSASTVAIGAIALQGIRRAAPTLGETFAVIGLGLIGQITVQLLKANGCRVAGIDPVNDRVNLAITNGMDAILPLDPEEAVKQAGMITAGNGVDGVIITASSESSDLISTAFRMCRKRGRVVLVGDVGLDLKRPDIYEKELDFHVATSYGPGRYDSNYEEQGMDYPIGYVRWTENRNMEAYLQLLAQDKVNIETLVKKSYPISRAEEAYTAVTDSVDRPVAVLLAYEQTTKEKTSRIIPNPVITVANKEAIGIAVIGAGSFARSVHLPALRSLDDLFSLRALVTRSGHHANELAEQYGASYATTDYMQVLNDPAIQAVLISTRHNTHANMVINALRKGKHVYVEKPLAINMQELEEIQDFYKQTDIASLPILMTGFNRQFAPLANDLFDITKNRTSPMLVHYRMNAGYIPSSHWVHGPEGGSRNIGEACHAYHFLVHLVGKPCVSISATAIDPDKTQYLRNDNFVACLSFADGSVGAVIYTAMGNSDFPKERIEIYVGGDTYCIDDFLTFTDASKKLKSGNMRTQDKGHVSALKSFGLTIKNGGECPMSLWEQFEATRIALEVENQITGLSA